MKKKEDGLLRCARSCLKEGASCTQSKCKYWIDYDNEQNCSLISIHLNGPMTLKDVGERLGLSLVRIKQIEAEALKKIQKKANFLKIK
tara:strand:- start:203 stop:466 length:264 start_codon:yes stop_codon:yes gene_type:complete